jgi:large subunit ribosomal protein L22
MAKEMQTQKAEKEMKAEAGADVKKEANKETQNLSKKTEAAAKGLNLHASLKHCMYISRFIKGKAIDSAIKELEEVLKFKKAVPFKGEIPHRSTPGIMSGRYPISAIKQFIPILKGLRGNVLVGQMDLDKTRIYYASPSWASRPSKRGGGQFKRVNIIIKAKEVPV